MSDNDRELTGDEATAAVTAALSRITVGFDRATSAPDRTGVSVSLRVHL